MGGLLSFVQPTDQIPDSSFTIMTDKETQQILQSMKLKPVNV